MFFQSEIIILVQRGSLVVTGQHQAPLRFAYPEGTVTNLEVTNRPEFIAACQKFMQESPFKGKRALLVLDYSVVFEKIIELDKTGQPDKLLQGFIDAMPFATGKRACFGVEDGSNLHLYATNAELYTTVEETLRASGISSIVAIVPVAAYNLPEGERTVVAATARILKSPGVSKQANFQSSTVA